MGLVHALLLGVPYQRLPQTSISPWVTQETQETRGDFSWGREDHSMEQYRSRLKLSENSERHWSTLISGEIHMDQSLVHTFSWGNLYGPMVLKVLQKFPPKPALVHGWLFPVGGPLMERKRLSCAFSMPAQCCFALGGAHVAQIWSARYKQGMSYLRAKLYTPPPPPLKIPS